MTDLGIENKPLRHFLIHMANKTTAMCLVGAMMLVGASRLRLE